MRPTVGISIERTDMLWLYEWSRNRACSPLANVSSRFYESQVALTDITLLAEQRRSSGAGEKVMGALISIEKNADCIKEPLIRLTNLKLGRVFEPIPLDGTAQQIFVDIINIDKNNQNTICTTLILRSLIQNNH